MSNANIGIDVSHYQNDQQIAGSWLFVVHAVGDGLGFIDPTFQSRFKAQQGLRGAYLYARPGQSDGATQANHFADLCLAAGFKKDVDIWQLDAEDGENAGITTWGTFIGQFMWTAFARLGRRAFLYAGWPFLEAHGLQGLVDTFQWWLPDYGINDGQVHPPQTPANVTPQVVLHQYTSFGNLDQNVVANQAKWDALAPPSPNWAALQALADFKASLPLYYQDCGPEVTMLKNLLTQIGEGPGNDAPYYGDTLVSCVQTFKVGYNVGNYDGTVFGVTACDALFKALG